MAQLRWSRRDLLRHGAVVAAATGVTMLPGARVLALGGAGAGSRDSRARAGTQVGGGGIVVVVPDFPFFTGTTMEEAPKLLNSLARRYQRAQGDETLEMTRFLFSFVPVTLFDRVYATVDPADALPMDAYLWLFHLSGYFGGVWLRGELVRTGKNTAVAGYSDPQDESGFRAEVAKADAALAAAAGPPAGVLEYGETSLFDQPPAVGSTQPQRGLVDTFGYNEGYLLQIVDAPPEGLTTPPGFVECPADPATRPLYCAYSTSRLRALRRFDPVSRSLATGKAGYAELSTKIPPVQAAGIERGRQVWDGALNVQGFSQEAYEQLLDISSAFLEIVQATALATTLAVAARAVRTGRQGATANALLGVWLASYIVGITDGREGRTLPEFESL
jgi:hypothetical protein